MKTYNNTKADEAYEAGQEWISKSDRWDKLEYLQETCNSDFLENHLMREMVRWMGEAEFDAFFRHLCQTWSIMTPPEMNHAMNS